MARLAEGIDPRQARFTQTERDFAFAVAMKYVRNEDEAADVAQEAMLTAYRHRASFRGQSRFTTWLYRVAATTALMHLRKKRRQPVELTMTVGTDDDEPRTLDVPATGSSPEALAAAHEEVCLAGARLDAMGERYGEVFARRFVGGEVEADIARELGLEVATVKTRAYRARLALRDALAAAATR